MPFNPNDIQIGSVVSELALEVREQLLALQTKFANLPLSAEDYASAAALEDAADAVLAQFVAAVHEFQAPDQSVQLRVDFTPAATQFYTAQGSIHEGGGATLVATHATDDTADVDANIVARNAGAVVLGNGSGEILRVEDAGDGLPAVNALSVTAGTTNANPAVHSPLGIDYHAVRPYAHKFRVDTQTHFEVRVNNSAPADPTVVWLVASGSPVSDPYCRLSVTGTVGAGHMMLSALGNSDIYMTNGRGNFARFNTAAPGAGTATYFLLTAAGSGQTPVLTTAGSQPNVDLAITAQGTGAVSVTSPLKVPGYAFASLPSAATYINCIIRVTDRNNRLAVSDGTDWRFMDGAVAS